MRKSQGLRDTFPFFLPFREHLQQHSLGTNTNYSGLSSRRIQLHFASGLVYASCVLSALEINNGKTGIESVYQGKDRERMELLETAQL